MFEKLMFWKRSEPSASTDPFGSSLNPLDVQTPPAFGDAHSMGGNQYVQSQPLGMGPQLGMQSADPMATPPSFPGSSMPGIDPFSHTTNPFAQPSAPSSGLPLPGQSGFGAPLGGSLPDRGAQGEPSKIHPRDIELILSRLELVRAEIENVNHRLSFIEQSMQPQSARAPGKGKNWY